MQPDHCLSWVPYEWPGPSLEAKGLDFWERRAVPIGLSRNPVPIPASVFCFPPPCPLSFDQGVGERLRGPAPQETFSYVLSASWEIQALGSLLSLAIGCFLGVLHVLFDFSLCPLLACAKVPCHYPPLAPSRLLISGLYTQ